MISNSFWQGKRVFLTGHTGFKGGWLSLWLQSMGVELTGYALSPPTDPSLFQEARVEESMNSVIADIRDAKKLLFEILCQAIRSRQTDQLYAVEKTLIPLNTRER
jgi:CDP-glucose 4,6-dehydratase